MDLTLTILDGGLAGRRFELRSPRSILLGRGLDCEVILVDPRVSRRHCRIRIREDRVEMDDLGSANGSFVNGCQVTKAMLTNHDVLRLADTELEVTLADTAKTERIHFEAPAATPQTLRDGLVVDIPGFALQECLGEGNFGTVFRARSTATGERVAIKIAKPHVDFTELDRLRFLREAAMAASLVHPNVVRVLGRGQAGATLYIVMEFVEGETLRSLIARRGAFDVSVALDIARQVGSTLEAARLARIVHRDVKPDNILVCSDGLAKLGDFGFAKSVLTAGVSGLTNQGDVIGTVAYMSPEQLESSIHAEHRSDIYSLGATLFHMLTGRTPFVASTNFEYFKKILYETPPLVSDLRPDVPPLVSKLVAKCLAKRAVERFQSAAEVVLFLGQLLSSEQRVTAS